MLALVGCASPPPGRSGAADLERRPIRAGDTLNCSKLIHEVRPVYPRDAKARGVEGTVSLRVHIARTGEVSDVQAVKGDALLIPAAISAVKQWRYTPCVMGTEAVEVITAVNINFSLKQ